MFEKVLVPLDGSSLAECVLPHVVAFANTFNAETTLLRVMERGRIRRNGPIVNPVDLHIADAQAISYLTNVADQLEVLGVLTKKVTLGGVAAERVIEYSDKKDIDLIVLSSHGRSGLSGWNVSSVVQKIILRAYRSVLIIRAYQPIKHKAGELVYRRLLVPLDGSQRAECVLPTAVTLAQAHDARLLLVHVLRRPEMPFRIHFTEEDIRLTNKLIERNREEAEKYMDDLRGRLPVDLDIHIFVQDDVAVALHELSESKKVDFVILSAHGYSGIPRWTYGSVTSSFIGYGSTPLLIIQDLSKDQVEQSPAELSVKEKKGH